MSPRHHFVLRWRPPVQIARLFGFLADRQIEGVEAFDQRAHRATVTRSMRLADGVTERNGWVSLDISPDDACVRVSVSPSFHPWLPGVVERVRHWLDLDADPQAVHERLAKDFPTAEGLRLPGSIDGFELAVRAILGQQVSVKAAKTLVSRLALALGTPIITPHPAVTRLFPAAGCLLATPGATLGHLGVTRQRQAAIHAIAEAMVNGRLALRPGAHIESVRQTLQSLPGIGPWTAAYIAMRTCGWTDAWLPGDMALAQGLGRNVPHTRQERIAFDAISEPWRPWRAYAVVAAWSGLYSPSEAGSQPPVLTRERSAP